MWLWLWFVVVVVVVVVLWLWLWLWLWFVIAVCDCDCCEICCELGWFCESASLSSNECSIWCEFECELCENVWCVLWSKWVRISFWLLNWSTDSYEHIAGNHTHTPTKIDCVYVCVSLSLFFEMFSLLFAFCIRLFVIYLILSCYLLLMLFYLTFGIKLTKFYFIYCYYYYFYIAIWAKLSHTISHTLITHNHPNTFKQSHFHHFFSDIRRKKKKKRKQSIALSHSHILT